MAFGKHFLAVLSVMFLVPLSACEDGPERPPTEYYVPFAITPERLLRDFEFAYETMDAGAFAQLFHPEFVSILQPSTIVDYPELGPTLDRDDELAIHERMFGRLPGAGPQGQFAPSIVGIDFAVFEASLPWAISPPTDPIPDTEFAVFHVSILCDRGEGNPLLRVEGEIGFYVVRRDTLYAGVNRSYYQLIGQRDMTSQGKGTESMCWGNLKAMFRPQ